MRRITRRLILLVAVVGAFAAMQGAALADQPIEGPGSGPVDPTGDTGAFLCPAVGDGVFNATANNTKKGNDKGVVVIDNPDFDFGYSFLPGKNQAGANANQESWNVVGPTDSPGPGADNNDATRSDWSPIWPGPTS